MSNYDNMHGLVSIVDGKPKEISSFLSDYIPTERKVLPKDFIEVIAYSRCRFRIRVCKDDYLSNEFRATYCESFE
jgi:hypothetical protein